ncbi:hypothetical protein Tsubulata_003352 [Turnera subulata]|uniref:Alpha/beta hydrolase fold-3 domain-containing protein n=1 Tax=Turnera subulata TaxID=218843 RepID=A0A9Q0GE09_9ROSI|nr:hypothetical protein Tsubulata_003352 [Turnera subulata]
MSDFYDHLHLKLNPDGTVSRFLKLPPASADAQASSGDSPSVTKTLTLDPAKKTSVRLYLPSQLNAKNNKTNNASSRLPIVVYFHGNSFVVNGTDNLPLQLWCSNYCNVMPAIIVLVDYRLAPENRLPAQYEDAIDALQWVKKQVLDPKGEPWLKDYGDLSCCYMHGDDSGGNIVFHAALRATSLDLSPLKVAGLIMNQPLFGGKQRTQSEMKYATDQILPLPVLDLIWELALPKGTDRGHRYCNPMVDGPHREMLHNLPRSLVIGFGMDPLIDRQQDFVEMLALNGAQVEAQFDQVGFHRIELVDTKRAVAINDLIKEFISADNKNRSLKPNHN